MVQNNVIL